MPKSGDETIDGLREVLTLQMVKHWSALVASRSFSEAPTEWWHKLRSVGVSRDEGGSAAARVRARPPLRVRRSP